jgi:trigger factor
MKIETERLPHGEVALSFEVDDARLERALDAAYRRVASRVEISGFRRGKAPRQLVERVVGRDSLVEEALNQLLPEVYDEARRETRIEAITDPEFDVESLTPLKAKATVIVRPPVVLGDYMAISKDAPEVSVAEDEINTVLEGLRERNAEWVPVERAVEAGDRVTMNITGTVEDETIIEQDDVDYVVNPESTAPLPGFAEKLLGASAGDDLNFDIEVAADSENTRIAGKTVQFHVLVSAVKMKDLPILDDYFATTVGTYKDLAELRAEVESQLKERAQLTARRELEESVLNEAVESATLELPDKLIEIQTHRNLDRLDRDLQSNGLNVAYYRAIRQISEEDLHTEVKTDSERSLRREFVLRAIADQENLTVTEDEIDAGIRAAFGADNADQKAMTRALKNLDVRERARSSLLEQRAVQWLLEHAIREPAPVPSSDPDGEETEAQ